MSTGMHVAVMRPMAGMPRIPRAIRLVLAATAWIALAGTASAQAPCASPDPAPCVIASSVNVPSGTEWDVGTRAFSIASGKTVTVQGFGNLSVRAADITLEANAKIIAAGTDGFGGSVTLEAANGVELKTGSRIDVAADEVAGIINIAANAGSLQVLGELRAKATNSLGAGGFVTVFGETGATIGALVDVSGGGEAEGGLIEVSSSQAIVINALLNASGGDSDGGEIDLDAGTTVTTQIAGIIDVHGRAGAGYGGAVGLTADGTITLNGKIDGTASSSADGDGAGGEVDISSETGDVNLAAVIDLRGAGNDGDGGLLTVSAGGAVNVTQPIQAYSKSGGFGFGGDLELIAGGALSIATTIDIRGGAVGGALATGAGTTATVAGAVLASGTTILPMAVAARGGAVQIQGCTVSVPQGGSIVNLGTADPERGVNRLQGGTMTIGGTLTAGNDNILEWRNVPPGFTGTQNVTPPPQLPQNLDLPCCGVDCTTTTTSSTTTSTTTTSTTSTVPETTTTSTTVAETTTTSTTVESTTTTIAPTTTTTLETTTTTLDATTTSTVATTTTTTTLAPSTTTTLTPATSTTTTTIPAACVDQPLAGYDAVECRLDTIDTVLAGENVDSLGGKKFAKRLTQSVARARTAITSARSGHKIVPNLRRANKQMRTFQKSVSGAQKKGLPLTLGANLISLASGATNEIGALRATQQ